MEYVLMDLDGAPQGHYQSLEDTRVALQQMEDAEPGISTELYVLVYDGEGMVVDELSVRGDQLLTPPLAIWSVRVTSWSSATGFATGTSTRSLTPLEPVRS